MSDATELQAIFSTFDEAQIGHIPSCKLGTLLRAAGTTPTEERVAHFVRLADEKDGTVSFADYAGIVAELGKETRLGVADIEQAFRAFDGNGTGLLAVDEIKRVLTTMGEALQPSQVDELIKEVDVVDGKVEYAKLARVLVS